MNQIPTYSDPEKMLVNNIKGNEIKYFDLHSDSSSSNSDSFPNTTYKKLKIIFQFQKSSHNNSKNKTFTDKNKIL